MTIYETELKSGMLSSASYDDVQEILTVTFSNGSAYAYLKVPKEVYDALLSAESAGKYFTNHIRNSYQYEKI